MFGSVSFLVAEIIGVVTIGILADQYGRKLMLLMCLYIPVVRCDGFSFRSVSSSPSSSVHWLLLPLLILSLLFSVGLSDFSTR